MTLAKGASLVDQFIIQFADVAATGGRLMLPCKAPPLKGTAYTRLSAYRLLPTVYLSAFVLTVLMP